VTGDDRPWFYLQNGVRTGPVTEKVVRHMIREDQLASDVLVWTDGMAEWLPAAEALPVYAALDFEAPVLAPAPDSEPETPQFDVPLGEPAYFPVSTTKFIVMSVATGGLYELYWSYRNWKFVKHHESRKIMPFWRAFFVLFFHYDLLKTIKRDLGVRVPVDYSAGWLTVAYLVWLLTWRLPDPFWIVSYMTFVPLLPVVAAINNANAGRVSDEHMNTRFTAWNVAMIVVFGVLQALNLALLLRPELLPS